MQSILANNYSIYFNENGYISLNELVESKNYSTIFILVDEHTNEFCLPILLENLATEITIEIIEIEASESAKNIETCAELWAAMSDLGADRKSVLINLGGGVVTDIGGFVASTYKRGIDFINIPTTLLGMVDAAIGGKNGVDLGNLKNQIGVIKSPEMLLIDSSYLETLPQNQMKSGLAEMLKHGLIADENYWNQFLDLSGLDFLDLGKLIYRSVEIKNTIVLQDPTENGIRKALNFGHTLGHAIESYFLESDKPLLHGEAIAVGMVLESYISKEKNLLSNKNYLMIKTTLLNLFEPIKFNENDVLAIIELLIHDKKNEYGKVKFVLLDEIGNIKIDQEVSNDLIMSSFKDYKN